MGDLSLDNFDKNDKLKRYIFESEWIKQFSQETDEVFEFKGLLSIQRKPKKDKLFFIVNEDFIHRESDFNSGGGCEFKDEETAIRFFVDRAEELKLFAEETKKNIVFDGRRYFWKIDENNKIIGREI